VGDETEVIDVVENGEECQVVWGRTREGQARVITLYGVDQVVRRVVRTGGVDEGEGRRGTGDPSGMSNVDAGDYEEEGRHVVKRNAKVGELDSRGAFHPIEKVGALCQNRGVGVP
jgi:hypothetical protein